MSEVMVGSLLGSLGSVDMDETSLAEEEEEAGCGELSITAAPVLREKQGNTPDTPVAPSRAFLHQRAAAVCHARAPQRRAVTIGYFLINMIIYQEPVQKRLLFLPLVIM